MRSAKPNNGSQRNERENAYGILFQKSNKLCHIVICLLFYLSIVPYKRMIYNTSTIMKRVLVLIFGDAAVYWLSLFFTLLIRWGISKFLPILVMHILPFGILMLFFMAVCYAMQLYTLGSYNARKIDWLVPTIASLFMFLLGASSFLYFYSRINPQFSPRGTLLLFWVIFSLLFIIWRMVAETTLETNLRERVLIVGSSPECKRIIRVLETHPEYGIQPITANVETDTCSETIYAIAVREKVQTIVTTPELFTQMFNALPQSIESPRIKMLDAQTFYEQKLGRIFLDDPRVAWNLIASLEEKPRTIDIFKTASEQCVACVCAVVCIPLYIIIALLVALTSRGGILYSQKRAGEHGMVFSLYKFRTMVQNAEQHGPQWAEPHDSRVTRIGNLLRYTHLDELPQLFNIMLGNLSFVGPRPERPEFVSQLQTRIPLYALRHTVKPGITGWAQLNYPYGASLEDAKEKLEYDLYYLKHQSLLLDASIVLKTVRRFFQNPEQKNAREI